MIDLIPLDDRVAVLLSRLELLAPWLGLVALMVVAVPAVVARSA